jgi:hypothetical protein
MWEGAMFRFRDIHLFDERFESDYLTKAGTSTQCIFTTLPIVDGFLWSTADELAGLRVIDEQGDYPPIGSPTVSELPGNVLKVTFPTASEQVFEIVFYEDRFEVTTTKGGMNWALELKVAPDVELPFQSIESNRIKAALKGFDYGISCKTGTIEKADGCVFRIRPTGNKISMDCSERI